MSRRQQMHTKQPSPDEIEAAELAEALAAVAVAIASESGAAVASSRTGRRRPAGRPVSHGELNFHFEPRAENEALTRHARTRRQPQYAPDPASQILAAQNRMHLILIPTCTASAELLIPDNPVDWTIVALAALSFDSAADAICPVTTTF